MVVTNEGLLGVAMHDARMRAGLTQEQLAERSGVSRRWIGAVEAGRRPGAEISRVFDVLRALGLGLSLAEVEPPPPLDPAIERHLRELGVL